MAVDVTKVNIGLGVYFSKCLFPGEWWSPQTEGVFDLKYSKTICSRPKYYILYLISNL